MICQFKYLCLSFLNQFKLKGNHVLSLKKPISSSSNYMKAITLPNLEGTSGEVLTPSLGDQQIAIWEKVMLKVSGHAAQVSLWVNTHLSIKRIWIICCKAFHRLVLGKNAPSLPPPSPSFTQQRSHFIHWKHSAAFPPSCLWVMLLDPLAKPTSITAGWDLSCGRKS